MGHEVMGNKEMKQARSLKSAHATNMSKWDLPTTPRSTKGAPTTPETAMNGDILRKKSRKLKLVRVLKEHENTTMNTNMDAKHAGMTNTMDTHTQDLPETLQLARMPENKTGNMLLDMIVTPVTTAQK